MTLKKNPGFTLMELMIIVSLIAIIATAVLILFNPLQQFNKGRDSRRKSELTALQKTFEDYYNDKNCYPRPNEVCYNAQSEYAPNEAITCNICGNKTAPLNFANFSPYLNRLPCDPKSPNDEYLYQVDDLTCPKWFRVYSELDSKSDSVINDLECGAESCGPKPFFGYDFGVTSPNTGLETTGKFYCYTDSRQCNVCGSYEACQDPDSGRDCQLYKKFYSSNSSCCEANDVCTKTYHCTYAVTDECFMCGHNTGECISTGKCQMIPESTIRLGLCP